MSVCRNLKPEVTHTTMAIVSNFTDLLPRRKIQTLVTVGLLHNLESLIPVDINSKLPFE